MPTPDPVAAWNDNEGGDDIDPHPGPGVPPAAKRVSDSAAGRPEIVTTESGERGEWWEDAWRESQRTGTAFEPCNADIGIADADYVLRWLKQTNAPVNVIELQERAIRILIATEVKRAVLDARP